MRLGTGCVPAGEGGWHTQSLNTALNHQLLFVEALLSVEIKFPVIYPSVEANRNSACECLSRICYEGRMEPVSIGEKSW